VLRLEHSFVRCWNLDTAESNQVESCWQHKLYVQQFPLRNSSSIANQLWPYVQPYCRFAVIREAKLLAPSEGTNIFEKFCAPTNKYDQIIHTVIPYTHTHTHTHTASNILPPHTHTHTTLFCFMYLRFLREVRGTKRRWA
jgi:hypothetical protein